MANIHKKMLNITKQQVSTSQNHSEMQPHTCQNDYPQKDHKQKSIGCGKREPLCTVARIIDWYSHCGKQYGVSSIK